MSDPGLPPPARVRWRERQTLRSADLADEQSYRLAGRGRHQAAAHRPGVAAGLGLSLSPAGLAIGAGTAVDAGGRTIVLGTPQTLAFATLLEAFDRLAKPGPRGDGEVVIAIAYVLGTGVADGRQIEECRIRLSSGIGAETADAVPLGAYHVGEGVVSLRLDRRARAALVAQEVRDPAGRARLSLHPEPSVRRLTLAAGGGESGAEPVERLRIDADRSTHLTGNALTAGRVVLAPPAGGAQRRVRFTPLAEVPVVARAWSLYRADFQAVDDAGAPAGPLRPQLRLEIGSPGEDGDPRGYLFAVGRRGEGGFTPCLRVDSECTLTVGDLRVEGQMIEGPIQPDPDDPAYAAAAAESYLSGIGAALGQTAKAEITVDVESSELSEGQDLAFDVQFRNAGPAVLRSVEVTSRLVPEGGSASDLSLIALAALAAAEVGKAAGGYDSLSAGDYSLVVTLVATAPGLIPVTTSAIAPIHVSPVIT